MSTGITVGVVSFPGSNGDHDALHSLQHDVGVDVRAIDYREESILGVDAIILPGGFAYGDALRCGAIARFSPVMDSIRRFAGNGGPVLGICNGFQVLCEAHLLPGALLRNASLTFRCRRVHVLIEGAATPWTGDLEAGDVLELPIAHGEGSYFLDGADLRDLERREQVIMRYCDTAGLVTEDSNPNGSLGNIAGICNEYRNVVGLMPHPERATDPLLGGTDGLRMLRSILRVAGMSTANA